MSSQSSGRRRSNMRQYSAEDQALNVISKEAEARLAAKRAARAEAREIRMKEIEKQEKESEGKQDRVHEIANEHSSSKSRQMSGSRSGSRRGSTESNDSDAKDVDFKAELRELEEKYKAAMMTSAQLDNEKQSLVYQVELLKDQLEEQDEGYTELQREHKDKCREYEFMKRDLKTMEHELNILKQQLEIKDKLIMESGFVILANDKGEPVLEKQSTNNGPLPSGAVLVSAETKDFLEKAEGVTLGTSVSDCTSSASPSPVVSTSSVDALDSVENKIEGSEWGNKSGNVDMVQLESSRDRASIETVHVCSSLSTKFNEPNDNSKQSECNINLKDSFDGTMSETNEGRVNLITKKHSNELSTLNIPKDTSIVSGEDSDECDEFFDAISTPSPLKKTVQEQESCGSSVDPDDTQQHASAQATFEDGSCVDLVAETHLNIQDKSIDKEAVGENEYQSSINNGNNSFTSEVNDKPLAHESEDNCLKQSDDLVINILNTSEVNADVNKISFEKNKVYSMDITEVDMNKSEKNEVNVEQVVSDVQDNDKKEDLGKSSDEIIYDNREVEQDKFRISEVIDASDQEEEVSMGDNVESLALNVTVEQCDLNSDNQVTAIGSCLEDIKKDTLIKEIDASSNITEVKEKDSIKADEEIVNQNEEIKIENVIKDTDQTASVITEVKQDDLIKANQEVDSQKEDVKMEDINKNSLSDISDIKPDDLTKADEVTVIDSGNEDVRSVKDDDLIKIYQDNFFDNQNVNIIKDTDQTVSDENADQEGAKVTENADQEGAKVTENADQEGAKVTENANTKTEDVTEVDLIKVYQDTVVDNQNTKIITDSNPTVTDDLIKADQEISNLNEKVNAKKKDVKEDNLIKTNVENQNEAVKIDNFIKDSDLTESGITEDKQDNLIKSHQEAVTVNQNENIKKEDLIIDSDPSLSIHNEDNDIKAYQENLVENEDGNVKRGDLINQTKQTVSNVTEVEQGDSSTEVDETTLYNSDKSAKLNETQCSTIQDNVESIGHNKVQDFKKDDLITNSEQIISPDTNENVISKVEDKLQDMNENEEVNMVDNKLTASDSTTGELASETQSDVQEDLKTNNGEDISSIQEECVLCLENVNSSISETVSVENPSLTSDVDGQGNVDTFHNTPSDNVPDRLDDVIGKSQILQKSLSVEGSEGEGLEGYDLDDIDDILQSSDKNQELKVNDILRDDKAKDEPHSETSSLKEIITSHKSVSESPTSSGHKKDKSLKSKLSIRKGKKEKHELSVTKGEKLDKAESHSSLEPENLESTLDKHLAEPGLSMTHKKSKKFSLFKKVFK